MDRKRCGGEKSGVLWELTLKTAGSGTEVSGTADSDKCSPAVSCTRSSDPRPPHCLLRRSDGETCVASPVVIPALLPSPVLDSPWLGPRDLRLAESVSGVLLRPQAVSCYRLKIFTHYVFLQNYRNKLSTKHPRVKGIYVCANGEPRPFPREKYYQKSKNTLTTSKHLLENHWAIFN